MTSVLYAALGGSSTTSDLYTIDPTDGSANSIGPIGYGVTGLVYDAGTDTLYGSTNNNSASDPSWLITVDRSTGAGTPIGPQQPSFNYDTAQDLAFSGGLYGWMSVSHCLATLDTSTGSVTNIGGSHSGFYGLGLDFDSGGVLYLVGQGELWTVDPATGTPTHVAYLSGLAEAGDHSGAASFDPTDTLWIVLNGGTGDYVLATADLSSGALSSIGLLPDFTDALCWVTTSGGGPGRPSVTLTTPPSGAHYATGAVVNAAFVCTAGSGGGVLASCIGTVPNGSPIDTATAGTKTFSATATDTDAQTRTVTHSYQVGADPPTTSITTPPNGAAYYSGQVVNASYACTPGAFGGVLASCVGDVANGSPIDTSTDGAHTFTVTATQTDGQVATTVTTYWVGRPDPPSVTLTTPPDGAVYTLGQVVLASFACVASPGSSMFSCFGDVANGHAIDTSTGGIHQFTATGQGYSSLYGYTQPTRVTHRYCVIGLGSALIPFPNTVIEDWFPYVGTGPGYYIHDGYVYLSGIYQGGGGPTPQTILRNLPAAIRPSSPQSVTIAIDPERTTDVANSVLELPHTLAATIQPNGTLSLDAPVPPQCITTPSIATWYYVTGTSSPVVHAQYTSPLEIGINLGGVRWPLPGTPPADTYTPTALASYLSGGDFTDIDSVFSIHNERVHLGGTVRARIDGATQLIQYNAPGLPPGSQLWANTVNNDAATTEAAGPSDRFVLNVNGDPNPAHGQIYMDEDRNGVPTAGGCPPTARKSPPPVFFGVSEDANCITNPRDSRGAGIDLGYTFTNPGEIYCITTGAFPAPYYWYGNAEGTVPGFSFDVADLLAVINPTPDFFLVRIMQLIVNGHHAQNSCVRGNTLFDGPAPGGPYPVNDTEAYNGSFINPGPDVPWDPTLAVTGSTLSNLDGTPYDATMDTNAVNYLRYSASSYFTPPAPNFTGHPLIQTPSGSMSSSIFPAAADGSLWWTPSQAGTISVDFPNLIIGGDGPNTGGFGGAPLPVDVFIGIEPLFTLRQMILRAGDVLDLTGAGWPGQAYFDCASGFTLKNGTMNVGQAISGIVRRARRILGTFGAPVPTQGNLLDTSSALKTGGGTASGGGQGIVRDQLPCFGCGEQNKRP